MQNNSSLQKQVVELHTIFETATASVFLAYYQRVQPAVKSLLLEWCVAERIERALPLVTTVLMRDPAISQATKDEMLFMAAERKSDKFIRPLVAGGANALARKTQDGISCTILMAAIMSENTEIVKTILELSDLITLQDLVNASCPNTGYTALMLATSQGLGLTAQKLLDNGADIGAKNHRGETCVDIAQPGVSDVLEQHMLDARASAAHRMDASVVFRTPKRGYPAAGRPDAKRRHLSPAVPMLSPVQSGTRQDDVQPGISQDESPSSLRRSPRFFRGKR